MTYTNIPKPTGTSYTNINTAKPSYDEPSISYDDPLNFYDGFNANMYTNISKPNSGISGQLEWQQLNIQWQSEIGQWASTIPPWININKPT